jgi:hypothetical protein
VLSLDLVTPTHIYTIEPQTKHEQWKWAMALNEAVTGVAWSNSRNFVGIPSDRLTKHYSTKATSDRPTLAAVGEAKGKESRESSKPSTPSPARQAGSTFPFAVSQSADSPEPAPEAAAAIMHALNEGMLVSFQFTVAGQIRDEFLDTDGGSSSSNERYVFSITDPNAMHHAFEVKDMNTKKGKKRFSRVAVGTSGESGESGESPAAGGKHRVSTRVKQLQGMEKEYDDFRRQFKVTDPPQKFKSDLRKYMRVKEVSRTCFFMAALSVLTICCVPLIMHRITFSTRCACWTSSTQRML